ncbi:MFS transporter [Curtobacterium flaccumfaciens pv. flaccumfaciens]|uniref:MFS transporter n=1 Tax=Curtobacterium flaccumfaciens TaxID=2035 RepID=UPI00217E3B8A|nr:MFS transporter [Curtobacterium flaccumfaciens]MCS6586933.1 MFS transporter [Curtobacterium flaccumfaciens pv. flaccumfaciens]
MSTVEQQVPIRTLVRRDTTLRRLLTMTLVDTLGRGAFFTLTSLYLITIVGIPAVAVGLGLTVAGAVGVASSLAFGHLADWFSARRMLVWLHVVQGSALVAYVLVHDVATLIVTASVVALAQQGSGSVRSAAIGRAFPGSERVRVRATMRTVTNIGIGVGTALAAIPLAIGTGEAYRVTMVVSGLLFVSSAFLVTGLSSARVDPAPADRTDTGTIVRREPAGRSPYRDVRFLAVAALTGVFGMQFGLFEVAVPLWVVQHTVAPDVLLSPLLLVNTVCVVLLQVRMSRGTDTVAGAARVMRHAGWVMALACGLWAAAGWVRGDEWVPAAIATAVLVAAAIAHSLAEITSSAAGWALSFELAPADRIGAYQGVYGTGYAVAAMVAPAVVTLTAIDLGTVGWAILAVVFLMAAGGVAAIAKRIAVEQTTTNRQG